MHLLICIPYIPMTALQINNKNTSYIINIMSITYIHIKFAIEKEKKFKLSNTYKFQFFCPGEFQQINKQRLEIKLNCTNQSTVDKVDFNRQLTSDFGRTNPIKIKKIVRNLVNFNIFEFTYLDSTELLFERFFRDYTVQII